MSVAKRLLGSCQTKVPDSIIKSMRAAGGNFREAKYCGKAHISCTAGDDASRVYLDWIKDIHEDPDVQVY